MSRETLTHLNTQTLIGYTSKRGQAWHYRVEHQGSEPNHYESAVPVADVRRRLFCWSPVEADLQAITIDQDGVATYADPNRKGGRPGEVETGRSPGGIALVMSPKVGPEYREHSSQRL